MDFDEATGDDPGNLFGSATRKEVEETSRKLHVCDHLAAAALECDYLYLWLDCDREGENICYEVLFCPNTQTHLTELQIRNFRSGTATDESLPICRPPQVISVLKAAGVCPAAENIFRATFSAVTAPELKRAFQRPSRPNADEANAVDARQEIDLKVGCAFTRLLTRQFVEGARVTFGRPDLKVVSYGPCQTPTLGFCVERARETEAFVPRPFWELSAEGKVGGVTLRFEWTRGRCFSKAESKAAERKVRAAVAAGGTVSSQQTTAHVARRPLGMNTVVLLKVGSGGLGMSPHRTMEVAERLYLAGWIS